MSDATAIERQIEISRDRLARLRECAASEESGSESVLDDAVEELMNTLEALSAMLEQLVSTNEHLAEAQRRSERRARRYLELFRLAPAAYIVTDEQGVIREASALAEEKLERGGRGLVGKPLAALVRPSDRDAVLECLSAIQGNRGRRVERALRFASGTIFHALASAEPRTSDGAREVRWLLRDISELEERDALRDEIERHLEPVVWLYQLDPLETLHASRAYETVWGRPLSALYRNPRDWMELIHPDDRARVEACFERLRQGEPFDAEYRMVRPDGEVRWIRDRGTPFAVGRGRPDRAAGFTEDISEDIAETKAAEVALREAERRRSAAVQAAERAEARERRSLARDLHDTVSQSLALARTRLGALHEEMDGADRIRRLREIESIITEVDERTRTLTFRLSPPVLHDLGLTAATQWLAEDLESRFALHVQVSEVGPLPLLSLELRDSLFRSLRELLINVARHAQTNEATVSLVQQGGTLTISVEDGGVGFDLSRDGSVGFGLESVRERMEALGGRLEIDSALGRGTRARLVVPVEGTA